LAGHETTATTLTAAAFFLGKHPSVQQKAFQEIQEALKQQQQQDQQHQQHDQQHQQLSFDVIQNLPYIKAIIKETLRLNTPLNNLIEREATEDTELLGYNIPKGTSIIVSLIPAHWSKKYWKNPTEFQPERWLEGEEANNQLLAFASGPRMCIGNKFAMLEIQIALTLLIQNFEWTLARSPIWKSHMASVTRKVAGGMALNLKVRQ